MTTALKLHGWSTFVACAFVHLVAVLRYRNAREP
jgi:hypothetical protein